MLRIKISSQGYGSLIVKFSCGDQDLFFEAVESFKGHLYENERRYDPGERHWVVKDCDNFSYWCEYAAENLAAEIEDLRRGHRQQKNREQSRTHKAKETWKDPLVDAYSRLFLLPTAPLCLVKTARRTLAIEYHPDKPNGNEEAMKQLNAAADLIEKRLEATR